MTKTSRSNPPPAWQHRIKGRLSCRPMLNVIQHHTKCNAEESFAEFERAIKCGQVRVIVPDITETNKMLKYEITE